MSEENIYHPFPEEEVEKLRAKQKLAEQRIEDMTQAIAHALGHEPGPFLSVEEAAKVYGRSTQTLAQWRSRGRGPDFENTGRVRYPTRSVIAHLLRNTRNHH